MDEHNTFDNQNSNEEYSEQDLQQNNSYQNEEPQQNNSYLNVDAQQNDTYKNNSYMNNRQPNYDNPNYNSSNYNNPNYNSPNYGNQYRQYQPYANIPPYNDSGLELEEPVKISEWVLCYVIMMIPCVNIIMMFVWAFSNSEKKSKSNFFKAQLILFGIMMVLMVLFSFAMVLLASRF